MTTALHIDCMDYMRGLKDNAFDLAIIDPPYGIGVSNNMGRRKGDKKSNYKKIDWDNQSPGDDYFLELFRVSVNQIIWGANHFINKIPFNSSCWIAWDKKFSQEVSFAQIELAWTSFDSVCKKYESSPNQKDRIHPTQKPVALYKWLLNNYAQPGWKILDTHLGSGSSRIAADELGFEFVGCEKDKDYFKDHENRFKDYKQQYKLFTPVPEKREAIQKTLDF